MEEGATLSPPSYRKPEPGGEALEGRKTRGEREATEQSRHARQCRHRRVRPRWTFQTPALYRVMAAASESPGREPLSEPRQSASITV